MTLEEEIEYNEEILDNLPLPKPERWTRISDYIDKIEEMFKDIELPSEMQGELLNFLSQNELADYLHRRFGVTTREEFTIYIV